MTASDHPSGRLFGLDAMRATAALLVVFAHSCVFLYKVWPSLHVVYFFAGLGVDLFFVLSGYLVGGLLIDAAQHGWRWVPRFWGRRWWRTLPSYYLFLLVNLLIGRWLQGGWPDGVAHVFFVQNLAWPHPTFFPEAWSLAIEELFYLGAPLLFVLFAVTATTLRRALFLALLLIGIGVAVRWSWVQTYDPVWDEGVRKIALLRLDAIAWGLMMAAVLRLWSGRISRVRAWLALAGGLELGLSAALFFAGDIDHSLGARVWVFALNGLGSALLLPWLIECAPHTEALPARATTRLAVWSYALYLVHVPVLRLWMATSGLPDSYSAAFLHAGAYVLCCIGAAAIIYRGFERPVLRWRDRVLAPR